MFFSIITKPLQWISVVLTLDPRAQFHAAEKVAQHNLLTRKGLPVETHYQVLVCAW